MLCVVEKGKLDIEALPTLLQELVVTTPKHMDAIFYNLSLHRTLQYVH
jgi:hypothetical protein